MKFPTKPNANTRKALCFGILLSALLIGANRFAPMYLSGQVARNTRQAHQSEIKQQWNAWLAEEKVFTPQDAKRQRQNLQSRMLNIAAQSEVLAVLRTYDRGGVGGTRRPQVYIWPHYAERSSIAGCPVWFIYSGWEMQSTLQDEDNHGDFAPTHYWMIAIRGVWPYEVLHSKNCS